MARIEKTLDLHQETWDQLDEIFKELEHEDLDETIQLLIQLGTKAVSLTSRENRTVKLVSGDRQLQGPPCQTCGHQRVVHGQEAAVKLGQDTPELSERQPIYDDE